MPATTRPRGLDCLRPPAREHGFEPLAGRVPAALDGTLYRVGPGRFADAAGPFAHWFDGEGLVSALRFRDGAAAAACRMVVPAGADRPDYPRRGRMGRAPRGLTRRLRGLADPSVYVNVANTALMDWQGRLFALFEAGLPTEIDPETLATLGESDLGAIRRAFGAHPHLHPPSGRLIGQGFVPPPRPAIDTYALPPDGAARHLGRVRVADRFPAHDLAVTARHAVTVLSPLAIDAPAHLAGRPLTRCLRWRPELGTEVVVTPLDGGPSRRLTGPALFYSHTAAAYEAGGTLSVLGIAAPDASLADWTARVRRGAESLAPLPAPGRLTEIAVDLAAGRVTAAPVFDVPMEFPVADPRAWGRRPRVVYGTGWAEKGAAYADFADRVLRLDLARGTVEALGLGDGVVVSEPVLVPDGGGEGEGWLLCQAHGPGGTEAVVIRAGAHLEIAARLALPVALPMSLHGLWRPRG